MDDTDADQPVDRFRAVDRVSASHRNAGRCTDGLAALQNLPDGVGGQDVDRHADDGECKQRFAAHGVDVGQCVGGGDAAKVERIIDNRHEEISGGDDGLLVVEAVDRSIIGSVDADQQVGHRQYGPDAGEDLFQHGRCNFAAAAATVRQLGQLNFRHHQVRPCVFFRPRT